jgi:hypothetical protein
MGCAAAPAILSRPAILTARTAGAPKDLCNTTPPVANRADPDYFDQRTQVSTPFNSILIQTHQKFSQGRTLHNSCNQSSYLTLAEHTDTKLTLRLKNGISIKLSYAATPDQPITDSDFSYSTCRSIIGDPALDDPCTTPHRDTP